VTGDRVLVTTAHRIQTLLRPTDTAARVGGDEFVVLCSGLHDDEAAWDVARRIQEVLADPISLGTTSIATSASIGIALASASGTSPDQLVRNADFAMYQAKQASRAGIALFDDRIHQEAANRMELEQALRQAVFQSQFVLHYQPLVDLVSGSLIGVEALLRWEHPERGLLQPETFIDIAEKSGLIVPIGNWVVHEASRQWAKWRDENGRSIDIAINVSAQQLGHPGFAATLSNALLTTGADPTHMLIEITESTFLDSSWAVTTELDKLTALGVQLVVDDFGTGYSSLLSLKRFTVSQIKVDRGFVAGLGRRAEDRVITSAILRLGQELGLTTVAEGVETPEQMFALRELGCQHAQGYLFAAAQPASDVLELLDRRWYVG
jgi:predicted signal transduction protein with EAL and GGDEF domain